MATARRLSYSLLISTLAFTVFAVVAFSGLFPWIEAQIYSPKVIVELQDRLDRATSGLEAWKTATLDKVDKVVSSGAFDGVFSPTASQEALQQRYQSAKLLMLGFRGGGSLRILSGDLTAVHFSTLDGDVKVRGDLSITYRPVAEMTGIPDLKAAAGTTVARILPDPEGHQVYFLKPWKDSQGLLPGYLLIAVALEDLRLALLEQGVAIGNQPLVTLGAEDYLLSLLGQKTDAAVLGRVKELRSQGILPPVQKLAKADGEFTVALVHRGHWNLLVPTSLLELDPVLKALLLGSFYTVLFLVTFLIANLRGEPLSVVTRKVKRFQLQVVKQYLDMKEQDKIQSLRDELARHSDEIRSDVRRSLGRIRRRDQEWVDRYIDTSWQEVMDLLRGPAPPMEQASQADWKRLETLLQQALTQGRFVVSTPPMPEGAPRPSAPVARSVPAPSRDVEDVEELDDLEEVEEAEALDDAGEDVEELSELDEAEPDAAELVEEVEELEEEPEDLEDAEGGLEDVGELESAEEGLPSSGSELETRAAAPAEDPVEDLEEAAEADELDDVEELDELEEGESDGNSEDEPGELEELSPAPETSSLFVLRPQAAEAPPMTMLEGSDDDGLEVLEELDDLEEAVEELEEEGTEEAPGDRDASWPLERLDEVWGAATSGVFDEDDDVVSLRDEIFAGQSAAEDPFGQLVGAVLAGPDGSVFEPLEEDLVPRHQVREWRWTGGGFDWDRFALGNDEVNLFRALSDIVTELDAFTAAILTESEAGWMAQSSVGFSDAGKTLLAFGPESLLSKSFLSIRALHVLSGGGSHPVLRQAFHVKDLKFLRSVLCVPLLFRHEPAWLLLGLRREPGDLLTLLAPRQVD